MDSYTIYREWFLHHYGREFACSREEWDRWCKTPARKAAEGDFDLETERREGWSLP